MERVESHPGLPRTAGLALDAAPRVRSMAAAAVPLRLALGAVFIAHGAQKAFGLFGGSGLGATAQQFGAMGLKPAMLFAVAVAALEVGGGILLVLGFLVRPIAALLCVEMIVASLLVHAPAGFFLNWACAPGKGHGIEFTATLAAASASLALLGPGLLSIDGSRQAKVRRRARMTPPPRAGG